MPMRQTTSIRKPVLSVTPTRKAVNRTISAKNIWRRPHRSDSPPRADAPTMMPSSGAAVTTPDWAELRLNSSMINGRATPTMKTIMPSRNLPAEARSQVRFCMAVIAPAVAGVPSRQVGTSSR